MNTSTLCPCCSEPLLRHARRGGVYWFCPHCHQEMPNLALTLTAAHKMQRLVDRLSPDLARLA
ncbi:hypothetical protein [Leptolyngbya sp. FACHB-711]|uniref:hypothetical protein n=1 Tax=unclassified Leptolyngbya TaxID=2650499 RepID=UPI0016837D69|nr:hypothetical protein [Leptolyngbya sp. FACHB-711]MBD1852251.1 hypothetical protein [Cyanobacteria bacterium FACHB-502]MBD2023382.1 hypothetical protein [Leptolyngbya sp. FACHB-711]